MSSVERILVIRPDNIGDLVLTTPFLQGLRQALPNAWIGVLVNSYNAPILDRNPWTDAVFSYEKLKHVAPKVRFASLFRRLALFRSLRRLDIDCAVLAASGFQKRALRLARFSGCRSIVGYVEPGHEQAGVLIDRPVPFQRGVPRHEVEDVFALGAAWGLAGTPPPARVFPDPELLARARAAIPAPTDGANGPLIGIHISARKPSQRWPDERYAQLARALQVSHNARILLYWAPGASDNAMHPGDDERAAAVLAGLDGTAVTAMPTQSLPQLVAALASCELLMCSDGGAMHIAAALGKPIVCLFGKSDATRWRPWAVPCAVLQAPSRMAADVSVEDVLAAIDGLLISSRSSP